MNTWKELKYKNTILALLSIIALFVLMKWPPFLVLVSKITALGYLGAVLGGILFVFTFTVAFGVVVLFSLAETHSLLLVSVLAGFGGLLGDLFIFRFVKDSLTAELQPLYQSLGGNKLTKLLHKAHYKWILPILGAIIIASPLPDEIGVTMMGLSKIKTIYFIALSFVLNTTGIFLFLGGLVWVQRFIA